MGEYLDVLLVQTENTSLPKKLAWLENRPKKKDLAYYNGPNMSNTFKEMCSYYS